jgi:dTDP-4-amino-4,6-dideoxygalactose transaminase
MSTATTPRVPLLDLAAQNGPLRDELLRAAATVLGHGQFIMGPEVAALEKELAPIVNARHVIGMSSGTDALLAALMALEVGPGHEVVTTPLSFFATAGAIARVGATPVFADIDDATFNLDPAAAAAAVTSRTRAVITVHLFGRQATPPRVSVPVVEDAAQSIGGGPLTGRVGCLSFFPSKNLGAMGDAGAAYTDDDALAERLRLLRAHGAKPKYYHQLIGGNFRLDTLQAALLLVKLPHLERWTAARRANAARYRELFAATSGLPAELRVPADAPGHVYNQFVVRVPRRDALREHLGRVGVATEIYYPVPFHLQACFASLKLRAGAFPHAEAAAREALALPIYPELSGEQQAYVVEQIAAFYRSA